MAGREGHVRRGSRVPALLELMDSRRLEAFVRRTVADGGVVLVLHEAADRTLDAVGLPRAGRVVVVVGPEGASPRRNWRRCPPPKRCRSWPGRT